MSNSKDRKKLSKRRINDGTSSRTLSNMVNNSDQRLNQSGFKQVSVDPEVIDENQRSQKSLEKSPQQSASKRSTSMVLPNKQSRKNMQSVSKFDASNQDKTLIQELSKVPKLRYALESLKKKDRFQVKEPTGGLGDYLQSKQFKLKTSIVRGIRQQRNSGRPYSIADSEIQKISDLGGPEMLNLSRDLSKESLTEPTHRNLKRNHNKSTAHAPV